MNNGVSTPAGDKLSYRCISKQQLTDAAAEGINIAFVGDDVSIKRMLLPTAAELNEHDGQREPGELSRALMIRQNAIAKAERAEVYGWTLFSSGCDLLAVPKAAQKLSRKLAARYPRQRFVVSQWLDEQLIDKKWYQQALAVGARGKCDPCCRRPRAV